MIALKSIAERLTHGAGAMHLVRGRRKGQCRILMYHGFYGAPDEVRKQVTRQCEHLRRHYRPVTLSELAECLRTKSPLPENGLAITVDDGYRDLQLVFPIFRSFGFTVTVYVVSAFADGAIWLWPDEVKHAFKNTALPHVEIDLGQGQVQHFSAVSSPPLEEVMVHLPNADRMRILKNLPALLGVTLPKEAPLDCQALTWTELRAMAAQGLEIGAHTRTHPILARLESDKQVVEEINGCKQRIEEALGLKILHFCYPNGRREDYNAVAIEAVRNGGYQTAVTTEIGLVKAGADPLQLNRLGVEPGLPELYFERCVAGWGSPS